MSMGGPSFSKTLRELIPGNKDNLIQVQNIMKEAAKRGEISVSIPKKDIEFNTLNWLSREGITVSSYYDELEKLNFYKLFW